MGRRPGRIVDVFEADRTQLSGAVFVQSLLLVESYSCHSLRLGHLVIHLELGPLLLQHLGAAVGHDVNGEAVLRLEAAVMRLIELVASAKVGCSLEIAGLLHELEAAQVILESLVAHLIDEDFFADPLVVVKFEGALVLGVAQEDGVGLVDSVLRAEGTVLCFHVSGPRCVVSPILHILRAQVQELWQRSKMRVNGSCSLLGVLVDQWATAHLLTGTQIRKDGRFEGGSDVQVQVWSNRATCFVQGLSRFLHLPQLFFDPRTLLVRGRTRAIKLLQSSHVAVSLHQESLHVTDVAGLEGELPLILEMAEARVSLEELIVL